METADRSEPAPTRRSAFLLRKADELTEALTEVGNHLTASRTLLAGSHEKERLDQIRTALREAQEQICRAGAVISRLLAETGVKADPSGYPVSKEAFWAGTRWPIPALALAALIDLGLSDRCIATYFNVTTGEVLSLLVSYGLR